MKDALEIKWKEHSYLLKLGTIILMDRPLSEIRNCSFDGRGAVQETSVFAGVVINIDTAVNQMWVHCAAYHKERAIIDNFARHGVTLLFERGDKWLITPSMAADMFKLKPVKLIDSNGDHIRDLVPDTYYTFRLHLDIVKKALPIVGSDERLISFFEWNTRIFKTMLNINGLLDPETDLALSKRQFPIVEDITNFQKQVASIKASEKFIPKKKPAAKAKSGGVAYTASSTGFISSHTYRTRPSINNNSVTLNHIPYMRNESITAAAVNGRYTTGHVGGFDAVDIHPELFISDPGHNRMEVYLEQRSDRPAIDILMSKGGILCIAGTPCIIMIDHSWNLSSALDRAVYSVEVYGDGQTLRLRGLPVDETNGSSASIYQLIELKWPNRLNQSRQAIQPVHRTDLPVIKLRDSLVNMLNGSTLSIEITRMSESTSLSLRQPGNNIIIIDNNGRAYDPTYLVVDASFLARDYCRSNFVKYYKVSFTSHGDTLLVEDIYYIEYNSSNREELIEYLVANHRLPQQEPEEVAGISLDSLREPGLELAREGDAEGRYSFTSFTLCDSVRAFSITEKSMLVDFDHMPDGPASKITLLGTVFAVRNRDTDIIEGAWQVVANHDLHDWTMILRSEYRNPDLNGIILYLRKLAEDEAPPSRRSRPEVRGGVVIPEPRFVEPPRIGDSLVDVTSFGSDGPANYVVQSSPRWSQEMYINGNWPSEPLASEPVENAASFWSQSQQITLETQTAPTTVNGQVGGYQYSIDPGDVVQVTVAGIDYEISVHGFGILSNTGNCVGEISVRHKPTNSISAGYTAPFQVRWSSMNGWYVPATGLRLVATAQELANFLDAFYGVHINPHDNQSIILTNTVT